jgi:hypothetical protein
MMSARLANAATGLHAQRHGEMVLAGSARLTHAAPHGGDYVAAIASLFGTTIDSDTLPADKSRLERHEVPLVRAAAMTSPNISDVSFMKIFRSRHSGLCRLTPDAHAKVLLTKSNGSKGCVALGSAASHCVNEPNGLRSTQDTPLLDA